MKPLATNHRVLTWLCFCPADENTSKRKKLNYFSFAVTIFLFLILCLISSIAYFFKFTSIDLKKSLHSILQIAAFSCLLYLLIAMFFLRQKLSDIFTNLSKMYIENENDDSYQFLARANEKSEWLWKMYFKFVLTGTLITFILLGLGSIIFTWLIIRKLDSNYWSYPGKFILPWNQHSVLGYFAEILFNIACGEAYLFSNGAFVLLFISICLHHQAFYEIFRHSISQLDCPDKNRNDTKFLGDLVDFHNLVKDFFFESAEVYSPIVMIQLVSSMLVLTASIFQLDQLEDMSRIGDILPALLALSVGITNLFLYCFFGVLATESFEKMADCLYESNWQNLPMGLQKYFVVMIANAQCEIHYHGFNVAVLNFRTFCAFLRATYTYFMMFRTLTE